MIVNIILQANYRNAKKFTKQTKGPSAPVQVLRAMDAGKHGSTWMQLVEDTWRLTLEGGIERGCRRSAQGSANRAITGALTRYRLIEHNLWSVMSWFRLLLFCCFTDL